MTCPLRPKHEPIGPLVLSAFAGPGCLLFWAAALDFAVLVVGGHIFGGLSHLEVAAVGHLTALVTAAAAVRLTWPGGVRAGRSLFA